MLQLKTNRGFSLVELLIAVALLGLLLTIFLKQINNLLTLSRIATLRSDVADIGQYLSKNVHCVNTLGRYRTSAGAISCPTNLILRNGSNTALPEKIANWNLQVRCNESEISIRIAELSKDGSYTKHPLTNAPLDFNNDSINPLTGIGAPILLCSEMYLGAQRVIIRKIRTTSLGYGLTNASCSTILSEAPFYPVLNEGGTRPFTKPHWQNIFTIEQTRFVFNQACNEHCKKAPILGVGGYTVDCSIASMETSCACYR